MIGGIDYSMTCPSICIYDQTKKFTPENCIFFYYKDKASKLPQYKNIVGMNMIPYESEQERFDNISEWAITILKKFKVTHVCMEGYAMGAKGLVFPIAENTGLIKHKMWQNNIKFITPAPTQVKKHFTGKGNAKKADMHNAFVEQTQMNISELLHVAEDKNPVSDIVDSYAMLSYYLTII